MPSIVPWNFRPSKILNHRKTTKVLAISICVFSFFIVYNVNPYLSPGFSLPVFRKVYGNNCTLYTEITPPGVIIKPAYGLGNQLFRYACSYALARTLKVPLYLQVKPEIAMKLLEFGEDSSRNENIKSSSARPFLLDHFSNIPLDHLITPQTEINAPSPALFTFNDAFLLSFSKENSSHNQNKFFIHGDFCQSEKFFFSFRKKIRRIFQPDLRRLSPVAVHWKDKIQAAISCGRIPVGIHVRRGDYTTHGRKYWATPMSFYFSAMELFSRKNPGKFIDFFVFSDDINSIKDSFNTNKLNNVEIKLHFVSEGKGLNATSSLDEFILMTLFPHLIISNSTFSWWAAYLIPSSKKVIIGPAFHPKFFDHYKTKKGREFKRKVIGTLWYPSEWIVLNPQATNTT